VAAVWPWGRGDRGGLTCYVRIAVSIFEVFQAGGIVSVPLLALSVLTLAAIAERSIFWAHLKRRQNRDIRDLLQCYPHDIPEAIARLQRHSNLPTARIFLDAIAVSHPSPEALRLALESATHKELPLLRRFNTAFDVAIGAAPLLGLLGTILGLIRSFASLKLGEMGGSGAVEVTGGISEALVSTAIGLVVAVVALISANIFRGFYRRYLSALQSCGNQLELLCLYQQAGLASPSAPPMPPQREAAIATQTNP
jgi:biopolymer transport protein ExbB